MMRRLGGRLRALVARNFSTQAQDNHSFICESRFESISLPNANLIEHTWSRIDSWPNHCAIECGVTGEKYTYSQLRKRCRDFGAGLLNGPKRIHPGSVVSLVLQNSPDFAVALLGGLEAGMVVSPINPVYGPNEIRHQICDSNAKVVITQPNKEAEVREACKGRDTIIVLTGKGEGPRLEDVVAAGAGKDLSIPIDPAQLALLLYSSGTTGLPKGVKLTHTNLTNNIAQFTHPNIRLMHDTTENYQEVVPSVLPFFHVYGISVCLLSYLYGGAKVLSLPQFEPQSFIKSIKEHKGGILHVVPPLVQFLAHHPLATPEAIDSVRAVFNGAAPMSPSDAEKLLSKKPMTVMSGYGLTEASPVICSCDNSSSDLKSVGYVVCNSQLKIANVDTGVAQNPSEPGEICCRGPQIMQGYHNNEEATSTTVKNEWLHTGDVGFVDKNDGKLYIVDRIKELIKVKGFQVAPVELEEILRTHSDVADVGIVGRPDDRKGEVPVAFVVPRPGKKPNEKALIDHVAEKVSAPYKKIANVIFVELIPRNLSGKILRKNLKEML